MPKMFRLMVWAFFVFVAEGQIGGGYLGMPGGSVTGPDCFAQFPHLRNRFSPEQLQFFCQQIRLFHEQAGLNGNVTTLHELLTPAQFKWIESLQITKLLSGNITEFDEFPSLLPAMRKEIRTLNPSELQKFASALLAMKSSWIDGVNEYDLLAVLRHPAFAPGAMIGAAFLPWHREYLRMFEVALRRHDDSLSGLPYWDSTLDSLLPTPTDSIVWTDALFGLSTHGNVTDGFFPNAEFSFVDLTESPESLVRDVGNAGRLPDGSLVEFVRSRDSYRQLTACVDVTLERVDRELHEFVGGSMSSPTTAAHDILFFLHHAFIDKLWSDFRHDPTKQQYYVANHEACGAYHFASREMKPFFNLTNIKAYQSHDLYDDYYRYEPVPTCRPPGPPTCRDSPYLYCEFESGECRSRVRVGGNCTGLELYDVCDQWSACVNGVCVHMTQDDRARMALPMTADATQPKKVTDPIVAALMRSL